MSLWTSFGLSLKNLFTKKGRTILTSFAGSIGIIGIALIFAVSQGMTTYIDTVQEDTLSSYPLTLEAQQMDMSSLLLTFMGQAQSGEEHENDKIYQKTMIYDLVNALNNMEAKENDLKSFKEYLEAERADETSVLSQAINGVQYTYNMNMEVYTESVDDTIIRSDAQVLMQDLLIEYFGMDLSSMMSFSEDMMGMSMTSSPMATMGGGVVWQEMLPGDNGKMVNELLEKQYDVIYGSWPTEYNEVVLVVDENNEVDDMTLYALGLKSKDEIDKLANAAFSKTEVEVDDTTWTYEEICDMEFHTGAPSDCFVKDELTGLYSDLRDSEAGLRYLYDNGVQLKVSGIIRPNEDAVSAMMNGAIGYTSELTKYLIEHSEESAAIQAQLDHPGVDIFTGLPFKENTGNLTDEEKEEEFRHYIDELDMAGQAAAYVSIMSIPPQAEVEAVVAQTMGSLTRVDIEATLVMAFSQQMGMNEDEIADYLSAMTDEELNEIYAQMVEEQYRMQYAAQVQAQMQPMGAEQLAGALQQALPTYTTEQCVVYYEEVLVFSDSSYETNLRELGYVNLDEPSTINLYASSFEN